MMVLLMMLLDDDYDDGWGLASGSLDKDEGAHQKDADLIQEKGCNSLMKCLPPSTPWNYIAVDSNSPLSTLTTRLS